MSDVPLPPQPATVVGATVQNFSSRKFLLTVAILAIGGYGFLTGKMDGGTYVALSTLVLSVYGTTSIADKKLNPGQ
jgi:hypothetical protein